MKNTKSVKDLEGIFIVQDPKRGTLFHDIYTKSYYVLGKSDLKDYLSYSSSLPLCIITPVVLSIFFKLSIITLIVMVVGILAITEIFFRKKFIYNLPKLDNYVPPKKEKLLLRIANSYSTKRFILIIVLSVALAACFAIYIKVEDLQGLYVYSTYTFLVATIIFSIVMIVALIYKISNKK